MFLSLNEICVVPLRSKIWATFVILAPFSDRAQHLGHPGDRVVDVAGGEDVLRHDVRAAAHDLDVEALVLVVAFVDRRVVAGELRLRDPLQLQLDRGEVTEADAAPLPPGAQDERPAAPAAQGPPRLVHAVSGWWCCIPAVSHIGSLGVVRGRVSGAGSKNVSSRAG